MDLIKKISVICRSDTVVTQAITLTVLSIDSQLSLFPFEE